MKYGIRYRDKNKLGGWVYIRIWDGETWAGSIYPNDALKFDTKEDAQVALKEMTIFEGLELEKSIFETTTIR